MTARSTKPETRNPILRLPAAQKIAELPPEARVALEQLLYELSQDARAAAEHSWVRHKAPMAAYWKAVAVYARHIRFALKVSAK